MLISARLSGDGNDSGARGSEAEPVIGYQLKHEEINMRSGKKTLAIAAVLAMAMASIGNASACAIWGKIAYTYPINNTTTRYYVAPRVSLPNYYYIYDVTVDTLKNALESAQSADNAVYFNNATVCPVPAPGGVYFLGISSNVRVSSHL